MENPEEVLQTLDEFTKLKPKEIPKELEDYLTYVAKTGDPVYQWSLVKCLFREKLLNVITEFYEGCPSIELPPCPNVDTFNYEIMKNCLLERLESFASAPFTVQRLCELLTSPKKQYSRADKFMRAVEKNILVVSTREPGQLRRAESSQPELVNGVGDGTGNEPTRLDIVPSETVGSSTSGTSGSFLNTEGAVQVIFEDGSLEKNHDKCYEDGYEDGIPRRSSAWFRDRLSSPDKITTFGSQIHSHVTARLGEGSIVDGNQLEEKYRSVANRGIIEEDDEEEYIEDDYIEPSRNVQGFPSQDSNPSSLDLEGAEGYCSPPSPEEHLETSVAVATIAEENSISVGEVLPLKEGELSQVDLTSQFSSETRQDVKIPESKLEGQELGCSDHKTEVIESVSLDCKRADIEEQPLNSSVDNKNTNFSTEVAETSSASTTNVSKTSELSYPAGVCTEATSIEAKSDCLTSSSDPATRADECYKNDSISACPSPKPGSEQVTESETGVNMPEDALVTRVVDEVDQSATVEDPVEPEVEPESVTSTEIPAVGPLDDGTSDELVSRPESDVTDPEQIKAGSSDETASQTEIPGRDSESLEATCETAASTDGERDREMTIQNERVESVIQENVDQAGIPTQEVLMQQMFTAREIPMEEKTSESEPEAMEVDETSQTVEEPMEQGDMSPTTVS